MRDIRRHLDIGSRLVILVTFVLFVAALQLKGVGHDLLLEAGVFLVSVKLILMAYQNRMATRDVNERLDGLHATLGRVETLLDGKRASESAGTPPDRMAQSGHHPPGGTS